MQKNKLTILTPTYNRKETLKRVFNSLKNQTIKNFEWIIIDDGSNDNTQQIVGKWLKASYGFEMKYIIKENGGKHTALNTGIKSASCEYIYILDSDDYIVNNAVETIYKWIETIKFKDNFVGVSGLKGVNQHKKIGEFPKGIEVVDATNLERREHSLRGDKAEVLKKEILLNYPFPEFTGENFLSEAIVWDKIADDGYKIRWFNKIICITSYLEDGLTKNNRSLILENFKGYTLLEKQKFKLEKFPYNYLAIDRYYKISNLKKLSIREIVENLQISYLNFFIGRILGVVTKAVKEGEDN